MDLFIEIHTYIHTEVKKYPYLVREKRRVEVSHGEQAWAGREDWWGCGDIERKREGVSVSDRKIKG